MASRLRNIRLRLATYLSIRRSRARRAQAHRRRTLPHTALLLPIVAAAVLLIALQPSDGIRATQPWKWAPIAATAFGSLPSPEADRASRDDSTASTDAPPGAAVTVRGVGPDAPPVTAIVLPTPTPAPTPVPAPKGPTHVVASGDNLWTIARRHSAELTSILRWNDGVDPDRLVAGQRILVPGGSKMKALPKLAPVTTRTASVRPAAIDRPAAPRAEDGDHIWPLEVRGTLTRRFSSAHPGIDIAAPQGTRVRAIASGTVVWSGWKDNGGGYVVEIEHPDGMRSTYNHNSKPTVERGDKVDQGDTIALVGSTGRSTGPHLDIRIRMGGRLVDPLGLF